MMKSAGRRSAVSSKQPKRFRGFQGWVERLRNTDPMRLSQLIISQTNPPMTFFGICKTLIRSFTAMHQT
ncbi:hypothetical protein ElyMa_003918200 [Elysia marginata]|uniref:Uncharacterized protein n=1 Tax=Elysia marginata TaxID=1093978 RepID=A0AAV4FQC8_9GAST|nr:hypothetical protein ElyMa_003918200 [Elysia marginata]